jgi:uncharacterized membrane protein
MPEETKSKLAEKLEEKTKFTDDELSKIKGFQSRYLQSQVAFGQIAIGKIKLESQIEDLKRLSDESRKNFEDLQSQEREFIKIITEKYGEGTLDPKTGTFSQIDKNQ